MLARAEVLVVLLLPASAHFLLRSPSLLRNSNDGVLDEWNIVPWGGLPTYDSSIPLFQEEGGLE
jgi:hypothetical protein